MDAQLMKDEQNKYSSPYIFTNEMDVCYEKLSCKKKSFLKVGLKVFFIVHAEAIQSEKHITQG